MKLTFLGTGSMVPTVARNHTAIFLEYADEGILIDCGEGTQRQFKMAKIRPTKVTKILITHWDGDHSLGLAGLIQTLAGNEYKGTLEIYGPKGTKEKLEQLFKIFHTSKVSIKITEVKEGIIFENSKFKIESRKLDHVPTAFGYAFIEKDRRRINMDFLKKLGLGSHPVLKDLQKGKDITWEGKKVKAKDATYIVEGKKIVFAFDTRFTENAVKLAKNADILIAESTFAKEFKEKAKEYNHMTSVDAAKIAKKAKAKKLFLTHFSQRYKSAAPLVKEAREVFKETESAEDLKSLLL